MGFNSGIDLFDLKGFGDVVDSADLKGFGFIEGIIQGADKNDRDVPQGLISLQLDKMRNSNFNLVRLD